LLWSALLPLVRTYYTHAGWKTEARLLARACKERIERICTCGRTAREV
jgi:hypothetical protein